MNDYQDGESGYAALTRFTPGNEVAVVELEKRIRADERAKCIRELEEQANAYVEKWAPIIGQDHAKADAFNILVAARRLGSLDDSIGDK